VSKLLAAHGAHCIDCDILGHQVYQPGQAAYEQLIAEFGVDVVDQSSAERPINRKALGAKVFGNPAAMKKLTDIVLPEIARLAQAEIDRLSSSAQPPRVICMEAAVLLEAGWQHLVDSIWVVHIAPSLAVSRLQARNQLSATDAQKRLDSQMSNEDRLKFAHVRIENQGDLQSLESQVSQLWSEHVKVAKI
jgi:dephospho-CoA kinase